MFFRVTWRQGQVEASVVLELADDAGAVANDLDGGSAVRKALVLQARPRPGANVVKLIFFGITYRWAK